MDLGLQERIALVTGSYRGTGRAIAETLAKEGARVWLHGFDADVTEREAATLRDAGLDVHPVVGDIVGESGTDDVARAVTANGAGIDILVNNYGVAAGPGWFEGTSDDWIESYQRNVLSGVRLVRHLVPGMRERGFGRVIFVGTVGSVRPGNRTPHYYAAKATLPNLSVGLAKELTGTGITVNTVSPGILATAEVKAHFLRQAEKRGWGSDWDAIEARAVAEFLPNPSARAGRVEEVGALVAFLAGSQAGYINGANLRIDGGSADVAV